MANLGRIRLRNDYIKMKKDPIPYITAEPLSSNIYEWHYVIEGPKDSDYYGGFYHGYLKFAQEYPFKAPSIYMITPNGRFQCRTRLCLSISDFHQETWNPSWSVGTILTGLLSFMLEEAPTFGSIISSKETRWQLARDSISYNLKDKTFVELFPTLAEAHSKILKERENSESLSIIETENVLSVDSANQVGWLENVGVRFNFWNGIFGNPVVDNMIFFVTLILICIGIGIVVFRDNR